MSIINLTPIMKSEKLPNPLIFNRNWNDLYPFITKLYFKLFINHNQYPTKASKVSYRMSYLNKDAIQTMDLFFCNSTFTNLKTLISLLEWMYNDASCKYTAVTKLKNLQQQNQDFYSFFSEFLGLISKLNWNKAAKVTAL